MRVMYHDNNENFIVSFNEYPDKYKQLLVAKDR